MSDRSALQIRRDEIAKNLLSVRGAIDAATKLHGRAQDGISLIVVTKTFPASDVALLAGLGINHVGENRDQEGGPKFDEVLELMPGNKLSWHFIGQLQRNKVKNVLKWADAIHSIDRVELANEVVKRAGELQTPCSTLVQVALDSISGRGGADGDGVLRVADALLAGSPGIQLAGLMAVAPLDGDPKAAFDRLAQLRHRFLSLHPEATWLSAGMSGDFGAAIEFGATHVRIGSSILGPRPILR